MISRVRKAVMATISVATLTATAWATPAAQAVAAGSRAEAGSATATNVAADAAWIRQGQLPDGAIAWYVDRQYVSPYLANYAAIGLAQAYTVTRTAADLHAAEAWLTWYAGHEDANGFVTNYDVSAAGVETSTGDMDSTDAYAGTYLLAVRAAYRAGAGLSKLRSLKAGIAGAVSAIEATQTGDGMTWAKPTWQVKYLMDQSEAYAGLTAAVELAGDLGSTALRARALADAGALSAGVASLWDPVTSAYDWARQGGGAQNVTDWTQLYPDAMEQVWATTFGLAGAARGTALLTSLSTAHPQWDQPAAIDNVNGSAGTVGYWPAAGWAYLRVGATATASAAATSIRTAALASGRAWPFTTGSAGQLIVLESGDLSLVG